MMSGSGFQKATDPIKAKEVNDKLAALMAVREKQDAMLSADPLSEKEYEAKYGQQPSSSKVQ